MKALLALVIAVGVGVYWFLLRPECGRGNAVACPPAELEEGVGIEISAAEACRGAGYLCNRPLPFQLVRWPLDKGKLRVRVTLPDFIRGPDAERIRDAAIEGIRQWDGRPFPLVIEKGIALRWDINVNWSQGLAIDAVGVANPNWSFKGKRVDYEFHGMGVMVPPVGSLSAEARLARVTVVASHEMGHALGILWHSDRPRDIMFPRVDAGASEPSERDFRTLEALYALPNGVTVR